MPPNVCVRVCLVLGMTGGWPCGAAGFIAGLFSRKISGSTEYQHWIMEVCMYTRTTYIHTYVGISLCMCVCA